MMLELGFVVFYLFLGLGLMWCAERLLHSSLVSVSDAYFSYAIFLCRYHMA